MPVTVRPCVPPPKRAPPFAVAADSPRNRVEMKGEEGSARRGTDGSEEEEMERWSYRNGTLPEI